MKNGSLKCKQVSRVTTSVFLLIFILFSVLDKIFSSLRLFTFTFPI